MPTDAATSITSVRQHAQRALLLVLIYSAIVSLCRYLAYEFRFDFIVPPDHQQERIWSIAVNLPVKLGFLLLFGQFRTLLSYFSLPDVIRIVGAVFSANLTTYLLRLAFASSNLTPRGVVLTDFVLTVGALCALRLGLRIVRERSTPQRNQIAGAQQRIAIVGAGDAGATLAKEFINSPSRGFRPVAFFDDDPAKHGNSIHGVPVIGRAEAIDSIKDLTELTKVVIAMPSASSRRIREIVQLLSTRGLKVETLPSMEELASGRVRASRIRPVEVQDLLGREQVQLDAAAIRELVAGRVVMVTGAGGSIGAELCRQIAALAPKRLLLVEQAEPSLFLIEQELNELGLGATAVPLVADILDGARMDHVFARYRPEIIFHAAAHKHVYLMERQPAEAIRNNVFGTCQLARRAVDHGVAAFVFISTDKAINPTSVMGATKRLAEIRMMAIAAGRAGSTSRPGPDGPKASENAQRPSTEESPVGLPRRGDRDDALRPADRGQKTDDSLPPSGVRPPSSALSPQVSALRPPSSVLSPPASETSSAPRTKFMAVRFGNVLGSSGSVIPIFKRQIANGGPVTVTHPEVTRYFMTIPEAVGLVLQASVQGKGGEIFVLDMGQPVKIADLARQMIELSGFKPGEDIDIVFSGLKPGEKLYEELQHRDEQHTPTEHPRIMRFTSPVSDNPAGVRDLEQWLHELEPNELKKLIQELVPEYTPFLD
jgi:FlaA1/EpsC-like NDP-sugar epimerase